MTKYISIPSRYLPSAPILKALAARALVIHDVQLLHLLLPCTDMWWFNEQPYMPLVNRHALGQAFHGRIPGLLLLSILGLARSSFYEF